MRYAKVIVLGRCETEGQLPEAGELVGFQFAQHDRLAIDVELANLLQPEGGDAIENCFVNYRTIKEQVLESRKGQGIEQRKRQGYPTRTQEVIDIGVQMKRAERIQSGRDEWVTISYFNCKREAIEPQMFELWSGLKNARQAIGELVFRGLIVVP